MSLADLIEGCESKPGLFISTVIGFRACDGMLMLVGRASGMGGWGC